MSRNRGATPYSWRQSAVPSHWWAEVWMFFSGGGLGEPRARPGAAATTYGGYYELSWDGRERPSDFRLLRGVFAPTYQVTVPAMVVCTSGRSVVLAMEKSSR